MSAVPTAIDLVQADAIHRQAARKHPSPFLEYVLKDEETGGIIQQAPIHNAWQELISRHKRLVIWSHVESGKAVSLDTPIPTPSGWVEMGQIQSGDEVFGSDGNPCRVSFATEVQHGRRIFEVRFDDGEVIQADADHQWIVASIDDRRLKNLPSEKHAGNGPLCACRCGLRAKVGKKYVHNHHRRIPLREGLRVVTTLEMFQAGVWRKSGARKADGTRYNQALWRIPLCRPIRYPEKDLPIPPYALGAWLGDGDRDSFTLTFHEDDAHIFSRCEQLLLGDCRVWSDRRCPQVKRARFKGQWRKRLRMLGVLYNKHIPDLYLTASEVQRRDLLAGLLDTDGYVGERSRVEFSSKHQELAKGVVELARSLGFKVRLKEGRAVLDGRDIGPRYRVFFTAREPVFSLSRKLTRQDLGSIESRAKYRYVTGIEEVPTVPVRCISVDSPDSSYLMGRSYTVTHNTQQVAIGRVLWELGRNPLLRTVIVSNTHKQAVKIVRSIAQYIDATPETRMVFPELRRSDPWTSEQLFVSRPTVSKDPSVQAFGAHGNVLGARTDLLILDDILDFENCRTPALRQDLWDWYHSTLSGRLTRDARVVVIGTAFHPDDMLHRLARQDGWKGVHYPILDPTTGQPRWPERWPQHRVDERRQDLGPIEFARQMLCQARDEGAARFKQEWIDAALRRGSDKQTAYAIENVPPGCATYTGVDLGMRKRSGSAHTVLFTVLAHPNGDREVLNIEAGRWDGPTIIDRIIDTHRRYMSIMIVENNAAQDFIVQFARDSSAVPIQPFTTGRNKAHPEFGIESMAAEVAGRKWIIPSDGGTLDPEINAWIVEMLYYDPMAHTGDRLMASWFAREGIRMGDQATVVEFGQINLMAR